jgi:hypothetical protein
MEFLGGPETPNFSARTPLMMQSPKMLVDTFDQWNAVLLIAFRR